MLKTYKDKKMGVLGKIFKIMKEFATRYPFMSKSR